MRILKDWAYGHKNLLTCKSGRTEDWRLNYEICQDSRETILNTSPFPTSISTPAIALNPGLRIESAAMDDQGKADVVRKPSPKPLQSSSLKTQYLILYNFVSALLWLVVLGRVVLLIPLVGFGRVYPGAGRFTKWTQTLALLEVVHSATGMYLRPSGCFPINS